MGTRRWPQRDPRGRITAGTRSFIIGHHQRLETTVSREPVAQMAKPRPASIAFYGKVCDGRARPPTSEGGTVLLADDS